MKLELKENMYVRTKDGIIAKILNIKDGYAWCDNVLEKIPDEGYSFYENDYFNIDNEVDLGKIKKASYNIIDLIEVRDIISFYEDIDNYKKQYVIGIPDLITLDEIKDKITNDNIRLVSILTKQEMEQMEYKVKE